MERNSDLEDDDIKPSPFSFRLCFGGFFCCLTCIPWVIYMAIYAWDNPDPDTCWTSKSSSLVFGTEEEGKAAGVDGMRDMADDFRFWCKWIFWVYVALTISTTSMGIFTCAGDRLTGCVNICGLATVIAFLFKSGLFWYGVALRSRHEGRVCAGRMIDRCITE